MDHQSQPLNSGLYKLHRLFFIAFAAFAVLMALSGLGSAIRGQEGAGIGLIGICLMPIGVAHWFAARGARDGASYGRTISRIIGSIWLIGIPIGTALGIYVWSQTGDDKWTSAATTGLNAETRA
jgi:hypothetical protein